MILILKKWEPGGVYLLDSRVKSLQDFPHGCRVVSAGDSRRNPA
jgi:hypothetical protein